MPAEGSLDQISEAIGGLRAEVRGIRDLMIEHQTIADREWTILRNDIGIARVKVDQTSFKVESLEDKLLGDGGITERLTLLERTAHRATTMFTSISILATIIAFILAHYGVELFKWLFGRN